MQFSQVEAFRGDANTIRVVGHRVREVFCLKTA